MLARPFPEEEYRDGDGFGGPDYHFHTLSRSQDFWEDRSDETVEGAEAEIQCHFDTLATTMTARWGEPETVDLWPSSGSPDDGVPMPEPLNFLSMMAGDVQVWRRPDTGRWLGLAICQADREFPIELCAAIGRLERLPAPS